MQKFKTQTHGRGRYYRKNLLLIILISSIPGLIIVGLIYLLAVNNIDHELQKLHQKQISQRVKYIDDQLSYLELSLAHWAFEPRFGENLRSLNFVYYFQQTRDISKTLLVMQGSHPLLKQVELYVKQPQPLLLNPGYSVLTDPADIVPYDAYLHSTKSTFWTESPVDPNTGEKSLLLIHKIPGGTLNPFGEIIFTLNNEKLSNLLQTLTPYNEGVSFIMNESNQIVASTDGVSSSSFDKVLQNHVLEQKTSQGSFLLKWNNDTYSVSYGTLNRIGKQWRYASASPMTIITKQIELASKIILMIGVGGLLFALLLAWFASRHMYSPIEKLIHLLSSGKTDELGHSEKDEFQFFENKWRHLLRERHVLEDQLKQELPFVKERFLLQLLQGHLFAYSPNDLSARMTHYGWDVEHKHFTVLHIQLNGFFHAKGSFSIGDEGLVTFAATNIVDELAKKRFNQFNVINFYDLSFGMLLITPQDEEIKTKVNDLCREMMTVINRHLKMRVTISVSKSTDALYKIPRLYDEVKQAANYRIFDDENQLIDLNEDFSVEEEDEFIYPFNLEREIIQAMRMGFREQVEQLVADFLLQISLHGAKEIIVQQSMLQLLGSIQHVILLSGIHPFSLYDGANMYEKLAQTHESQDILAFMTEKVIGPYMDELESRSNLQTKQMVEMTMVYIQNNYMGDISLESSADFVGTNPYTLSRAFKQIYGKNFITYLTEYRMEKAKDLLRNTQLKIADISEHVGYRNSYFNRIFKKVEGVTPGQYRESYQNMD